MCIVSNFQIVYLTAVCPDVVSLHLRIYKFKYKYLKTAIITFSFNCITILIVRLLLISFVFI